MGVSEYNSALRLLLSIINSKSSTKPVLPPFEKPPIAQTEVEEPFERCRPEDAGISSIRIKEFLQALYGDPTLNMHSVLILKDGKVITEATFGAYRIDIARLMFSACKSIVSLLFGILVGEKKVRLNEKIADIFSDKTSPIARLQLRDLTIRDVLTMRSGILFNEVVSMTTHDWVRGYLSSPLYGKIGETFNYNSMNTFMLVAIIDRRCGVGFEKYLESKLFAPLGITGTYWEKSPTGLPKGGWGLYIKPEDMAKIAQMTLDGGIWKGQRIVPEEYLKLALSTQAETPESYGDFNYGFQIWCGRKKNTFLFNGMLGQDVLVFRDNRIIIVSNAGNSENFQQSNYFKHAVKYFGGKINYKAGGRKSDYRELKKYIRSLSAYRRFPDFWDMLVWRKNKEKIAGLEFIPKNDDKTTGLLPITVQVYLNTYTKGLSSLRFSIEGKELFIIYKEKSASYKIRTGIKNPVESELKGETFSFRIASKTTAAYDEDKNLVITVRIDFIETPVTRILKLRFKKSGVTLEQHEIPGSQYVIKTVAGFADDLSTKSIVARPVKKLDMSYMKYKIEAMLDPKIEMDIKYAD